MEVKEIDDQEVWESFLKAQEGAALLQSWHWKSFLELEGHKTIALIAMEGNDVLAAAMIAKIALPAGKYYLYSPRGPIFRNDLWPRQKEAALHALITHVGTKTEHRQAIFIRFDPAATEGEFDPRQAGLRKAGKEVQPQHTSIVDISVPEEEIIRNMKQSARQSMRSAEKRGAVARAASSEDDVHGFYSLLARTAERSGFYIYPESHYLNLWKALRPGNIRVYLAEAEGKLIGGIMIVLYGSKAIYLHAASDYEKREYLAPYLLQLQAIRDLKQSGVTAYDLWGVAPEGAGKDHPWYGISFFKKGLGGNYTEYIGSYDYAYRPFWYNAFIFMRALRRRLRGLSS